MEKWKDINNFPGYQVSDLGRVRSFWKKERCRTGYGTCSRLVETPYILPQSDDGNGYAKVAMRANTGKTYCKKVHRLVAESFIPRERDDLTVDHIRSGPEGKMDNSVGNLRWLTRSDNIKKAYLDGVCDRRIARQNKPIIAIDLWTGEERYFESIKDAAYELNIDRSSISHVLLGDYDRTSHYAFEYAGKEERMLYGFGSY